MSGFFPVLCSLTLESSLAPPHWKGRLLQLCMTIIEIDLDVLMLSVLCHEY